MHCIGCVLLGGLIGILFCIIAITIMMLSVINETYIK